MARTIKQLPPRRTKYPWSKWMDGRTWEVKRGADFECDAEAFQRYVVLVGRRRGKHVETQRDGDVVSFQFGKKKRT